MLLMLKDIPLLKMNPDEYIFEVYRQDLLYPFLQLCLVHGTDAAIGTEQVQPADSYERIYDSGKPGHIPKEKCNQIKAEKPD